MNEYAVGIFLGIGALAVAYFLYRKWKEKRARDKALELGSGASASGRQTKDRTPRQKF